MICPTSSSSRMLNPKRIPQNKERRRKRSTPGREYRLINPPRWDSNTAALRQGVLPPAHRKILRFVHNAPNCLRAVWCILLSAPPYRRRQRAGWRSPPPLIPLVAPADAPRRGCGVPPRRRGTADHTARCSIAADAAGYPSRWRSRGRETAGWAVPAPLPVVARRITAPASAARDCPTPMDGRQRLRGGSPAAPIAPVH